MRKRVSKSRNRFLVYCYFQKAHCKFCNAWSCLCNHRNSEFWRLIEVSNVKLLFCRVNLIDSISNALLILSDISSGYFRYFRYFGCFFRIMVQPIAFSPSLWGVHVYSLITSNETMNVSSLTILWVGLTCSSLW